MPDSARRSQFVDRRHASETLAENFDQLRSQPVGESEYLITVDVLTRSCVRVGTGEFQRVDAAENVRFSNDVRDLGH